MEDRRTDIGLMVFAGPPRDHLPAQRIRAMAAEAALQGAVLSLFSAKDCDLQTGRIALERWSSGDWRREPARVPDVVVVAGDPVRPEDDAVRKWLEGETRVLADRGPDKLRLPRMLAGGPLERLVIPHVELAAGGLQDQLKAWLLQHGSTVVKAANGKRGGGIHFLHPDGDAWRLTRDGEAEARLPFEEACALVCRRISGRMRYRPYLAQRYVRSVSRDGRAADLRVHLQKRPSGGWDVTRAYARLAEVGAPVANTSRGGYQGPIESFLSRRAVRPGSEIAEELLALAVQVAEAVERGLGASLMELGVDFAIDESDRLWLIETNTRPQTGLHEAARAPGFIAYALSVARAGRG